MENFKEKVLSLSDVFNNAINDKNESILDILVKIETENVISLTAMAHLSYESSIEASTHVDAITWFNIGESFKNKALSAAVTIQFATSEEQHKMIEEIHKTLDLPRDNAIESAYASSSLETEENYKEEEKSSSEEAEQDQVEIGDKKEEKSDF